MQSGNESIFPSKRNRALQRRLTIGILTGCMLVGLGLRILLAGRSGLWRDEGLFLFIVHFPTILDIIHFLHYHESHPPLFYLIMRAWQAVFGSSDASALALPLLLGALFPIVVFLVGRAWFGVRAALLAAVLASFSPGLCAYSAQVRPYSLLPMLCLVSVFFLWQGLQGRGKVAWPLYTLVTLAMLYTHNFAWLVLLGEWVAVGLAWILPALRPQSRIGFARFVLCQAVILLGYAPWMPILLYQARHAGHSLEPLSKLPGYWSYSLGGAFGLPRKLALLCLATLIWAWGWYLLRLRRGDTQEPQSYQMALWLCLGVPLAAFFAASILFLKTVTIYPYTCLIVVPCLLLAVSDRLARLYPISTTPPYLGYARIVLPGIVLVLIYQVGMMLLPDHFVKSNAREVAQAVASQAQPGDLIVIAPEWLASSFNYYFPRNNQQIDYPHEGREGAISFADVAPRFFDLTNLRGAEACLKSAHHAGRRVWLIVATNYLIHYGVQLPAQIRPGDYENIRSTQLREYLLRLYGQPVLKSRFAPDQPREENVKAFLFAPLSSGSTRQTAKASL